MHVVRPTPDQFDEALSLLQAAGAAVSGDSDRTGSELREEWDGLDGRPALRAHGHAGPLASDVWEKELRSA